MSPGTVGAAWIVLVCIVAVLIGPLYPDVFADYNYILVILKTIKRESGNEVMQMHIHIILCHVFIAPLSTQALKAAHSQSTYAGPAT